MLRADFITARQSSVETRITFSGLKCGKVRILGQQIEGAGVSKDS